MMFNTTVREEWNSFEDKCLNNHTEQGVRNAQLVFYASYHAALLCVIAELKAGLGPDNFMARQKECEQFWRDQHVPLQQETVSMCVAFTDPGDSDGGEPD